MPFQVESIHQAQARESEEADMPSWKADRRLYNDADGNIVEADAPVRKWLLAAAGATISDAVCRRYRLGPYAAAQELVPDLQVGDEIVAELAPATETPGEEAPRRTRSRSVE